MTGLEKMINQILAEAKAIADEKIAAANSQGQEIIESAKAEAEKSVARISQKSQADVANYKDRAVSSADLQKRMKILSAKQEILADIFDKAYKKLVSMETAEYFTMLLKILDKHLLAQEGEIYFSPADLERMSADFQKEVEKAAITKGGKLTISKEGKNIENGFVLVYGGIEENCTVRAMFDAKKDDLADIVCRLIFA